MKSKFVIIFAIWVSVFTLPTMAAQKSSQQKPNILVIWGDCKLPLAWDSLK